MKNPARLILCAALGLSFAACFENLSEADLSDPAIKARVEAQLQAQRDLDLRTVTVDVHDRTVTVSGAVNSWNERKTIERIVRNTKGVAQVLINLLIRE